jgi:signal transduction histidine kinase
LPQNGADGSLDASSEAASTRARQIARKGFGISAKLLLLTLGFVMLAEVLIFVPSIANFRITWLKDRMQSAEIAALAAEAAPDGKLPEMLRQDLLKAAGVRGIAIRAKDRRQLVLADEMPPDIDQHFDLRTASVPSKIMDALMTFVAPAGRIIRVVDAPGMDSSQMIEVVMAEQPLRQAMVRYGLGILGLSLIISGITASLVYFALNWLLVRPMQRLTQNVINFAANPNDGRSIISPSVRGDEIGRAETALASMERDLRDMLQQKSRLASLGLAVSKISHDLRNVLASAQLISDRLGMVKDPTVERITPKLIASLDRAIRLCQETLTYGKTSEPVPQRRLVLLKPIAEDVGENLGLPRPGKIEFSVAVPVTLAVDADPDQLYRILGNLCRNSVQVFESANQSRAGQLTIRGRRNGAGIEIEVVDNGPGIPERARKNLFVPFEGGARPGGTGLGLAIVQELVRAHGGEITLLRNGVEGAAFLIELPDATPARANLAKANVEGL